MVKKNFWKIDIDDLLGTFGLCRKSRSAGMGTFVLGVGVGVLVGSAVSVLFTPYSGPETRRKIKRAGEELGRTVSGKVGELTRGLQPGQAPGAPSTATPGGTAYGAQTRVGV